MNTGHKIIWKSPMFREPQTLYERDFAKAKEQADQFAQELLVAEVYEYHAADASDARRVYIARPDLLQLEWSMNGRRIVVLENGAERFVKIGGEVVKLMVAPKPPKPGGRVEKAIARNARRPRMSARAEAAMWREYWAEHDRKEVRNGPIARAVGH